MGERVDLDAIKQLGEYVSDCRWSAEAGVVRGLDDAEYPEIAIAVRDADGEWIAFFDPPTVLALAAEVRAGREFRDDIRAALSPGRWRGFDGPDGVSTDEVLDGVDVALTRFDARMSQRDTSGTCPNGGG